MGSESNVHVVVFPFLSKSHIFPLLDLSKALSRRGAKITIITTPGNSPSMRTCISDQFPNIHLKELQFPCVEGLPEGCENTSQLPSMQFFLKLVSAIKLLQDPFEKTLLEMSGQESPPTCVISDTFLGWTNSSCQKLGIPRIVFNGMGVFAMFVKKYLSIHQTNIWDILDTDFVSIGGMQHHGVVSLKKANLPRSLRVKDDLSEFFVEAEKSDIGSWGAIANSFLELESSYVDPLKSLYGVDASLFCVGPLFLLDETEGSTNKPPKPTPSTTWAKWLDEQTQMNSVIYVSFGTQSNMNHNQLDELAYGLEMSGHHYIWVTRSEDWTPPSDVEQKRGLITRDFVDQKWVLAHNAVGGFLSHCGWNSVLECFSAGLPILAWPLEHEQPLNAKYLVEELKAGLHIPDWAAGKHIVGREAICQGVKGLMGRESGKLARENASKLRELASKAVHPGGSSHQRLNEFINQLHLLSKSQIKYV